MALPFIQLMIGIGVGVLGFLLLRPRHLTYNNYQQRRTSNDYSYQSRVGETCVICLERMTAQNMQELKCGHALHSHCYEQCLKNRHLKCPTCRAKF